jgi:hypothetical protein
MCLAVNRYEEERVAFRNTILVGLVVKNPKSRRIEHIAAYFNRPEVEAPVAPTFRRNRGINPRMSLQLPRRPVPMPKVGGRGNAMLISLPVKKGTKIGPEMLIAVKDYKHFMEDYQTAVAPPVAKSPLRRSRDMSFSLGADGPVVVKGFDGGLYDVVIARTAAEIPSVIAQVDDAKRPQLNTELFRELDVAHNYEMVHFLFCFSEEDSGKAGCVAIRYTPADPKKLFLPGVDGHNGKIERGDVELNHTLVVGSYKMKPGVGNKVYFRDFAGHYDFLRRGDDGLAAPQQATKERPYWMLDRVIGAVLPEGLRVPQGDFEFDVAKVERGEFLGERRIPSGWANLPDKPKHPGTVYITN